MQPNPADARVVVLTATGQPPTDLIAEFEPSWTLEAGRLVDPPNATAGTVVLIDGRTDASEALACSRALRSATGDDGPAIGFLCANAKMARLAAFESGADACLSTPTASEVRAQVRAMLRGSQQRTRQALRASDAVQFSQRLREAHQQIEQDLELAHKLQASFLPTQLPTAGPLQFAISYRPCGKVGGDFYDAFRLDEHHVGFYLADAMGHGIPASLLTIFLKKAVQTKEIRGKSYRLIPPGEVLARLNRELIAQGLGDLPFITMVYGLIDSRNGRMTFARAAHPHPVYLPASGPAQVWEAPGTLLGVFEADYPPQYRQLQPGDKLLLYTDGLGADETGVALAEAVEEVRDQAIGPMVAHLSQTLMAVAEQPDDFTLFGIEYVAG